jgi:hypothetical protein
MEGHVAVTNGASTESFLAKDGCGVHYGKFRQAMSFLSPFCSIQYAQLAYIAKGSVVCIVRT